MDLDINLPLVTFWHSLAESPRIDSPGCAESCKSSFDGECSLNIWERTYAISNWKSSWHEGCNLQRLFPGVRIATSCKQKPWELVCVESTPSQCKIVAWISSEWPMLHPIDVASASCPAKRLWVQRIPAQHHCHFVLCCVHGSGHQSSTGNVLAQLGWRLHPLDSWFLQLSWVGVRISTDTMNPRNVHFLLLRTLRLPFVC